MKGPGICNIRMQLSVTVPQYIEIIMAFLFHFSVFLAIQEWLSDTVDKIIVWN